MEQDGDLPEYSPPPYDHSAPTQPLEPNLLMDRELITHEHIENLYLTDPHGDDLENFTSIIGDYGISEQQNILRSLVPPKPRKTKQQLNNIVVHLQNPILYGNCAETFDRIQIKGSLETFKARVISGSSVASTQETCSDCGSAPTDLLQHFLEGAFADGHYLHSFPQHLQIEFLLYGGTQINGTVLSAKYTRSTPMQQDIFFSAEISDEFIMHLKSSGLSYPDSIQEFFPLSPSIIVCGEHKSVFFSTVGAVTHFLTTVHQATISLCTRCNKMVKGTFISHLQTVHEYQEHCKICKQMMPILQYVHHMLCTPDHQNENMPGLTHLQAYQRSIHLFYYLRRPTQVKTLRQALTETQFHQYIRLQTHNAPPSFSWERVGDFSGFPGNGNNIFCLLYPSNILMACILMVERWLVDIKPTTDACGFLYTHENLLRQILLNAKIATLLQHMEKVDDCEMLKTDDDTYKAGTLFGPNPAAEELHTLNDVEMDHFDLITVGCRGLLFSGTNTVGLPRILNYGKRNLEIGNHTYPGVSELKCSFFSRFVPLELDLLRHITKIFHHTDGDLPICTELNLQPLFDQIEPSNWKDLLPELPSIIEPFCIELKKLSKPQRTQGKTNRLLIVLGQVTIYHPTERLSYLISITDHINRILMNFCSVLGLLYILPSTIVGPGYQGRVPLRTHSNTKHAVFNRTGNLSHYSCHQVLQLLQVITEIEPILTQLESTLALYQSLP